MGFEQAKKEQTYLKAAIAGPSGSGKTFSALRMAKGIASVSGEKIGFIDTERRSARKYSDLFDFMVSDVSEPTVDNIMKEMDDAKKAGIGILIIDSISHPWKQLLALVDKTAEQKFRGNSFRAWAVGTPIQEQFINAILDYPGHLICCMRAKTEYVQDKDEKDKTQIRKVGMAPIQGKDIEYEFDILFDLDRNHSATVNKSHVSSYDEKGYIEMLNEDHGIDLYKWATDGEKREYKGTKPELLGIAKGLGLSGVDVLKILEPLGGFEVAKWQDMIDALKKFAKDRDELAAKGEVKAPAAKDPAEKNAGKKNGAAKKEEAAPA